MKDHPPVLDKHTDDAEALDRELGSINIRLGLTKRKLSVPVFPTLIVSEMPYNDRETSSAWKRRQANEEIALINQQLLVLRQARTSSHDEASYKEFALGQGRKVLIDKKNESNVSKRLTLSDAHTHTHNSIQVRFGILKKALLVHVTFHL